jgi:hypothetical protein
VGSARHKRCSWPIGARQEQWLRAHPQATAAQAATLAPRPPFNARVETVTTKPFFREPFTPNGGLVVQSRLLADATGKDRGGEQLAGGSNRESAR